MENTGYIALSKQMSLYQEMNLIANNIANANSTGYKSQHMLLTEEIMGDKSDEFAPRMVMDYGQFQNLEQGPLTQTGNMTDFALNGKGYFSVRHAGNDQIYYTRAGNFTLNNNNELVTSSGHLVLGVGGGPITLPDNYTELVVDKSGTVFSDEGEVGVLDVVEFQNDQVLTESGDGLYSTNIAPLPQAENTQVIQGTLERSNVQAVVEMTRMIDVSRQYQMNQTILQNDHERIRNAIGKLGRIS